jgi:hypothetical protein
MDITSFLGSLVIPVLVKLYSSIREKDWQSVETIIAVFVISLLVGVLHIGGVSVSNATIGGLDLASVFTLGGFVAAKFKK